LWGGEKLVKLVITRGHRQPLEMSANMGTQGPGGEEILFMERIGPAAEEKTVRLNVLGKMRKGGKKTMRSKRANFFNFGESGEKERGARYQKSEKMLISKPAMAGV